jgi:hypothetical protein
MALILSGDTGVPASGMPTGSVIQTVSTAKTDVFTTSSTSFVDVTGMSVSITPISTTSKIMVFCDVAVGPASNAFAMFQLVRNSTEIYKGTEAKTYVASHIVYPAADGGGDSNALLSTAMVFMDSPATTSAVTYKLQAKATSNTLGVNRRISSDDASLASSITVMEIKA